MQLYMPMIRERTHLFEFEHKLYRLRCQFVRARGQDIFGLTTRLDILVQGSSGDTVGSGQAWLIHVQEASALGVSLAPVFQNAGPEIEPFYRAIFDSATDFYRRSIFHRIEDLLLLTKLDLSNNVNTQKFFERVLATILLTVGNQYGCVAVRPARISSEVSSSINPAWSKFGFRPTGTTGFWSADFSSHKEVIAPSRRRLEA